MAVQELGTSAPTVLVSTAQNLTTSWADLGGELNVIGYKALGLWVNLDINDSLEPLIRMVGLLESGGDVYEIPIQTVSSTEVSIDGEEKSLPEADGKYVIPWYLDGVFPFVKFQAKVGTVGSGAGQIDAAEVTVAV